MGSGKGNGKVQSPSCSELISRAKFLELVHELPANRKGEMCHRTTCLTTTDGGVQEVKKPGALRCEGSPLWR